MRKLILIVTLLHSAAFGQGLSLKAGDSFPGIRIGNIMNSPVKGIELNALSDQKFYVLNFWGTWCSPCIPEMDALAKLQSANAGKLQVIAISDDSPEKLKKYLQTKPTTVWLATDTTALLYKLFNLASVSHSAIIGPDHKVVAVMKTHSITQGLLDSLYKGEKIVSDGTFKERPVQASGDIFAVDSTLAESFTIRSYMVGQGGMSKRYSGKKSPYYNRRITFVNTVITYLYKTAYNIVSSDQIIYEVDKKKVENYEDKTQQYNVDLLVKPEQRDSLLHILQKKLDQNLPVSARIIYKEIPVYVLTNSGLTLPMSTKDSSYGFSGNGYDGTGVTVADFTANYLNNELDLPVVDETGLTGKYDIKTSLDMRTVKNVISSVEALGLKVEKRQRRMPMLVLYEK